MSTNFSFIGAEIVRRAMTAIENGKFVNVLAEGFDNPIPADQVKLANDDNVAFISAGYGQLILATRAITGVQVMDQRPRLGGGIDE